MLRPQRNAGVRPRVADRPLDDWQGHCPSDPAMARRPRYTPGGFVYHVCNRGSRKGDLFSDFEDYVRFLQLVERAREKRPMRIPAYSLMKTHFHFLLWPTGDNDVPRFMKWLTGTHAQRWHRKRGSTGRGAVYQSRYVSRPITDDRHYFAVLRYVERNALQAGLVERAELWPWCSVSERTPAEVTFTVDPGPFARLPFWLDLLNN
jgi:putative transposase